MKFCYCDETGTGEEPYAVLVGVIVDSSRMHLTKEHWSDLLTALSKYIGKDLQELHTRNFYAGNGVWRGLSGAQRSQVIDTVIKWFSERKHHVIFTAIDKKEFQRQRGEGLLPEGIDTLWKAMGFHIVLGIQKRFQSEKKNKGNTVFIFDEEVREEAGFQRLILEPPDWCHTYYEKGKKQKPLDQIVDAPYFADSKNIGLIQVADFFGYFIRRYIEIETGAVPAKYGEEREKIGGWYNSIKARALPAPTMYPKKNRCEASELFWGLAPDCIRDA